LEIEGDKEKEKGGGEKKDVGMKWE